MINKKAKRAFKTIQEAALAHELCLVECTDRKTNTKVNVICATVTEDGAVRLHPLGKLFSGNPFNEVAPPGASSHKLI